jgi:stalled ribosome rescue protein Dom34
VVFAGVRAVPGLTQVKRTVGSRARLGGSRSAFLVLKVKLMPHAHVVVWLDHHAAAIHRFGPDGVQSSRIQVQEHQTRQHNSGVRAVHTFFGEVCDGLSEGKDVLVTGSHTTLSDFRHYVVKHRPELGKRIAGYEAVDHPTDGQLVAFAREFFARYDNLRATRPLA